VAIALIVRQLINCREKTNKTLNNHLDYHKKTRRSDSVRFLFFSGVPYREQAEKYEGCAQKELCFSSAFGVRGRYWRVAPPPFDATRGSLCEGRTIIQLSVSGRRMNTEDKQLQRLVKKRFIFYV
jgi:hypothetical protein